MSDMIPVSVATQEATAEDVERKAMALLLNRYKDRFTTLPKEKGWLTENVYLYQGFWHESFRAISLVTVIASQESFQAQPTDIYLASLLKSGTTWMKALSFAIVNRAKYPTNSPSTHPLQIHSPHRCVPFIETESFQTPLPTDGHSSASRLFSTHMPYTSLPQSVRDTGCRLVYICRNPKDVLVSLFHFANKMRDQSIGLITFQEAFEMFSKGATPCGPYWDHVKGYYKASLDCPSKILFLTYEEMQKDTLNIVMRLAKFLGYPFTEEEEAQGAVNEIVKLCGFESLRDANKNGMIWNSPNNVFFRKGETGDGKNHLTEEMSQILDQITKEKFNGLDISF